MKRFLLLVWVLFLVGGVDASCRAFGDWTANITIPNTPGESYNVSLYNLVGDDCVGAPAPPQCCKSQLICNNTEGQLYVRGDLSNVKLNLVNRSGYYNIYVYSSPADGLIFLNWTDGCVGIGCPSEGAVLEIILNGTEQTYFYNTLGGFSSSHEIEVNDTQFTRNYRRNWTFRNEVNNNLYSFTGHNATLTVSCNILSSFSLNLTSLLSSGGSVTIQTAEKPKFSLMVDGVERIRSESASFLKGDYYILVPAHQYRFNLADKSGQCNGLLVFEKSLNDSLQTIWSGYFGLEYDAYVFLSNTTDYRVKLYCNNGGLRDFGFITLWDVYTRNIEVTNVDVNVGSTKYVGNLSLKFVGTANLSILSLNYAKTSGVVDSVNFTVYDTNQTPYLPVYSTVVLGSTSGALNYNVNNISHRYLLAAYVVNNGSLIQKMQTSDELLLNYTSDEEYYPGVMKPRRVIDLGLPSEMLGVSDDTIYFSICMFSCVVVGLGFAAIDTLFAGIAVVAFALLFDVIKWWDVPNFLKVVLGLIALACYWGMYRRTDE